MRVLYLSYNGLLDPLGQSQVLQYAMGLARAGHQMVLVTYEKSDEWMCAEHREATQRAAAAAGIRWIPLAYHRKPSGPATAYDVVRGAALALLLALRHRIQIVHARGYVVAVIGLFLKKLLPVRFIFDPRSSWPDERVEMGIWRAGTIPHRVAKWFEERFFSSADAVVFLTEVGARTMREHPILRARTTRTAVITTCTNLEMFRPHAGRETVWREPGFTLGYLGTVGTPYMLDEVFTVLRVVRLRRPAANLLIINRRDGHYIAERARSCGVSEDLVEVKSVIHSAVPAELSRVRVGAFFYEPTFCQRFRAPTKLGEFLACGIPCIANMGVGDVERILKDEGVGVVVPDFATASLEAGVDDLLKLCDEPDIAVRCAAVARRYFSLQDGVRAYDALYAQVVGG